MSWNELWDYVSELLREPSSHLSSALAGDRYVPTSDERALWTLFDLWLRSQPGRRNHRALQQPWSGPKPTYGPRGSQASPMTPERVARRNRLAALF